MRPDERRDRIISLVREHERVSVDFLAGELDASRETIRRDLTELDGSGHVKKFHGGAGLPEPGLYEPAREGPFHARLSENALAKRAIARRAISLFRPGDTLFVDTGTTTLVFGEELSRAGDLTVITNSGAIAGLAARGNGNAVFLIGGQYREAGGEALGALAIEQVGRFHALHAVLTVGAVSAGGIADFDHQEAELARAMVLQARKLTVLADASKFDQAAPFAVAPLARVDRLVTERAPDGVLRDALLKSGTEIVLAGSATP